MRIVAIADDDSLVGHLRIRESDLLLSLGDIWDRTIEKAQDLYQSDEVFAVKGNHDSAAPFPRGITDMHLKVERRNGMIFGGFGGSWKYKPRGHHLYEQHEVAAAMRCFPRVDVFLAHNSPKGIHERDSEVHQGFEGFVEYIEREQPQYFLHGHQHLERESMIGNTRIIGVFGEVEITLQKQS